MLRKMALKDRHARSLKSSITRCSGDKGCWRNLAGPERTLQPGLIKPPYSTSHIFCRTKQVAGEGGVVLPLALPPAAPDGVSGEAGLAQASLADAARWQWCETGEAEPRVAARLETARGVLWQDQLPSPWVAWRRCGRRTVAHCRQFNFITCMCKCVCMFVIFLRLSHSSFQLRLALYQRVVSVAERLANLIVVPCRPHWYQSDNTGWHLDFFLIGRYNSTVSEAAEIPVLSALTRRWPKSRSCPWLTGVRHSLLCHITCLRFRTDVWIVWCLRTMT